MSLAEEVELLKRIPLFANIDTSKLKLLAFTSERVRFPAGQVLCRQGEIGRAAFIIIDGEADVIVDAETGPLTVASVGRNDFVGEIAILCDVPRTATVQARTDVTALVIAKDQFFRMITEFPQMAIEIMRVLALRLERTTKEAARARQTA
ncbi:MAG TPA: cyclic nucleotide-binding domain-containing protein [Inquilinus sp.]|uniref:cyclic nucleotide-binding domain-containing protein n=1 Tax=Bacteria TaxID=2 RepID=UPI00047E664A|nr:MULTISPECIES: cyclic nucleotide-binding domain-containing protein [Bacteria]TSD88944.1 cyclic nucleotide-binding domain-containing protein [Mycobacterium sp. KBS0706]